MLIQVYVPTSNAEDTEVNNFYNAAESINIKEIEQYTIIWGDWNAKMGRHVPLRTMVIE